VSFLDYFLEAAMGVTEVLTGCRFRGAYTAIWEKEPLTELFGEMDVIDDTLPGMADKIIAHQASHE
jgi:2-haloacid dehalogenase